MSLAVMYGDELKGFYRSRVMLFLWAGLPLLALGLHAIAPEADGKEMPFTTLSALIVSSICGTLVSVMLTVSIVHEKSTGVYSLFLIRPVRRWHILMGKFLAVYTCVAAAALITIGVGLLVDLIALGSISTGLMEQTLDSLAMSFSMMAISSAAGVLIGVISPSVLVGVILVLYGGNQVASLSVIPAVLDLPHQAAMTMISGLILAFLILGAAMFLFNRKQF